MTSRRGNGNERGVQKERAVVGRLMRSRDEWAKEEGT